MRYERDGYSIESGIRKGRPLPDWYVDEPELIRGAEFFLKAFRHLNSCRSFGMSLGPIPWSEILLYAKHNELDFEATNILVNVISSMDSAYLNWQKETNSNGRVPNQTNS